LGWRDAAITTTKTFKMKLYINILLLLLSCPVVLSCSDDDTKKTNAPYEQYGTPFTNMPKKEDAVIYQVNVRSFGENGTLNEVRERLSYIRDLGVNVIYLMPIYPIGQVNMAGVAGSPYSVKDYKAVNPTMGSLEDLRALVNEAHNMNMGVILDWVANHTSFDNAWITEHPEWYVHNEQGDIISPPGTNWADVAQLDYTNNDMRAAMKDAMVYWVYNANIDGFRCDAADFVGQGFWTEAITQIRGVKNQNILMLAEGTRDNHFTAGFDYTFGFAFFDGLKDVYNKNEPATKLQDVNAAEYANNYDKTQRIVRYTTNHDVNLSDGTPIELFKGDKGSMAAFVTAAYMKSVPMIYNAQEIGYNQRIDYFSEDAIDWSSPNNDMLAEYKKIIAFRNTSNALKKGDYAGYSNISVNVFTMKEGNETVLVLCNMTNANANYIAPPALTSTSWTDAFSGNAVSLGEVNLLPYQYIVLKN
jgi:glycosidase